MELRVCTKCDVPQDVENFSFAKKSVGRRRGECRSCERVYKQANKERLDRLTKEWRKNNPDRVKASDKKKELTHAAKISARKKTYREKNKARIKILQSQYYLANKKELMKKSSEYKKKRRLTDPAFKLRTIVSRCIALALKRNSSCKNGSCLQYLSYSMEELREHIAKQFEPWMTWDNQGKYDPSIWNDSDQTTWTWQLDHIVPQSVLPYTSMTEDNFRKCWALENLRPLSAKRNHHDGVNRTRH